MAANGSTPAAVQHDNDYPTSTELVLPFARVKKLMKEQEEVKQVGADAVFAMGRATELLLQELSARAGRIVQETDRKTIQYKDVAEAVRSLGSLEFLYEVVPEKVLYAQIRRQQEQEQQAKKAS